MLKIKELHESYTNQYKNIIPIGANLRQMYENKWFRVHHLKNKRYPETKEDNDKIAELYNKLFDLIMGKENIIGYLTTYDEMPLEELTNSWLNKLNLMFLGRYDISYEEDNELNLLPVYGFLLEKELLQEIVLDIADDSFYGKISFYSLSTGNIIAPYDGGIDIFIYNPKQYNNLQNILIKLNYEVYETITKKLILK